MSKLAINKAQYNRIHQVIHGVAREVSNVERSCIFFAIVGTYLLKKHFGVAATAVAGGFALCVDDEPKCISYGKIKDGRFTSGADAFHMWVQTQEQVIDFMAPIYSESFEIANPNSVIPRKMFQKLRSDESKTLDDLTSVGDYIVFPDPELTKMLIDRFFDRPGNVDLLQISEEWFGQKRGSQRSALKLVENDGTVRRLRLPKTVARGIW